MNSPSLAYDKNARSFITLLQDEDIAGLSELLSPAVVGLFPLNAGLFLPRIEGKEALVGHFQVAVDTFDEMLFSVKNAWTDDRRRTTIVQFDGQGHMSGLPDYHNSYLMIFEFDSAGLITTVTEYYNAMATGQYFGMITVDSPTPASDGGEAV